jgi:hypothetical protein
MFGGAGAGAGAAPAAEGDRPDAEGVFADVFEEVTNFRLDEINPTYSPQLLRPEVERHAPWWSYLGAVCGSVLCFSIC